MEDMHSDFLTKPLGLTDFLKKIERIQVFTTIALDGHQRGIHDNKDNNNTHHVTGRDPCCKKQDKIKWRFNEDVSILT